MLSRPSRAKPPITEAICAGGFIVFTEGIRQPGVRMGADKAIGDVGQRLHMRTQIGRTKRAIQAHRQRTNVLDGVVKRFGGLTR